MKVPQREKVIKLNFKNHCKMTEEKNQALKTQRKIELQVIPCADKMARKKEDVDVMNHESQDGCVGKIIVTIDENTTRSVKETCDEICGTKEEWLTINIEPSEIHTESKFPKVSISSHSKLTKADSGRTA